MRFIAKGVNRGSGQGVGRGLRGMNAGLPWVETHVYPISVPTGRDEDDGCLGMSVLEFKHEFLSILPRKLDSITTNATPLPNP